MLCSLKKVFICQADTGPWTLAGQLYQRPQLPQSSCHGTRGCLHAWTAKPDAPCSQAQLSMPTAVSQKLAPSLLPAPRNLPKPTAITFSQHGLAVVQPGASPGWDQAAASQPLL